MNIPPTSNRKKATNPVQFRKILQYSMVVMLFGFAGLVFVHAKNQQFARAEQIRQTERKIRAVRAANDVLLAKVTELSSRRALLAKIADGSMAMKKIQDNMIARLTPPVEAGQDGVLRTAFNERARP